MARKLVTDPEKLLRRCMRLIASQTIKLVRASRGDTDPLPPAQSRQLVDYTKLLQEMVKANLDDQDAVRKRLGEMTPDELRAALKKQLEELEATNGVT